MVKSADQAIQPGDTIEEFRVVRILGAGNFGIVYAAENIHLDETVAIKEFLPTELARREEDGQIRPLSPSTAEAFRWARERFLQEARTLWGLGHPRPHPSIVRVTRYQEANGSAYMFMEFEHGQPLSELLDQRGTLSYAELRPIIASLLDGLERVHSANILHRDIKPANILIRQDGSPVFIDFGAARNVSLSGETSVFTSFTPRYAAIEQLDQSGKQGPWTDIYALGATLYRAVTGVTPKSASEQMLGERQERAEKVGRGSYPDAFLRAIDAACALRPEDRPQTVEEWHALLFVDDAVAADETVVLPHVSPTDLTRLTKPAPQAAPVGHQARASGTSAVGTGAQLPRRAHATPWGWITLALSLITLSGVAGWLWWTQRQPEPAAELTAERPIKPPAEPLRQGPVAPGESKVMPERPQDDRASARPEPPAPTESEASAVGKPTLKPRPSEPETIEPFRPGQRFSDPLKIGGAGPAMIALPPGELMMGSPADEVGHHADERLHPTRVDEPFAMSQTEITIGQFARFSQAADYRTEADRESTCLRIDDAGIELVPDLSLSWDRPGYPVDDLHPVVCVTWNDAKAYADWLSEQTGRTYRLPTEQEWEYAARAATSTSRYWGDDPNQACRHANTADETVLDQTDDRRRIEGARAACYDGYVYSAPVGTYAANAMGLKDMIGNVAEWTCSVYDSKYGGAQAHCRDKARRSSPAPMVLRGGSWLSSPDLARSASRDGLQSNLSLNTIGFRVVATEQPWSREPPGD